MKLTVDTLREQGRKRRFFYCFPGMVPAAGWVNMPQYYVYSSASNYCEDGAGVLKVDLLDSFFRLG
jgi:hypothetical protein